MKRIIIIVIFVLAIASIIVFLNQKTCKRLFITIYKSIKGIPSVPQKGTFIWGIDFSHHQNNIDWDKLVYKNRPDFIFLKATEGSTFKDTKYSEYLKKTRELGIPVGAYHFFSYQSNGETQAKNFIENAKLKIGDLHPVLDVEFRNNMMPQKWIISEIKSYSQEIKNEYGVFPIIYCECDYYTKYLKLDFKNFNYWISDLYREPKCDYVFWQYTAIGFVEGIGNIDNNRLNKTYKINDFILSGVNF